MKKIVSLALSAMLATTMVAGLASCGEDKTYTIGLICLHGSESTYDKNFIDAMKTAAKNKGLEDELTIVTGIPEGEECYDTAIDLVEKGCKVIFADSFGHEAFMLQAAEENPDVQFCHATGTMAHTENVSNFQNAFASIYEGRYLAGVAAGMKIVEMHKANTLKESNYTSTAKDNIKIGYVGAWPYAEVKSGYTSYYLGVKSVLAEENLGVTMEVQFTNSWYDEAAERSAAQNLISRGAALISQHADSMGAPSACEAAGVPNVSYNGSTASACPNTYIISSRINWVPYFEYMIDCTINGKEIDTDWCGGLGTGSEYTDESGAVVLTELGSAAAAGTAEKLVEVRNKLKAGTVNVFDTTTFTVGGVILTTYLADVNTDSAFTPDTESIIDGVFAESKHRSAPYFDVNIDGIVDLTNAS
ncbi:MAG: BMP family ABC transporter substrate-binding protein [Clostridia bacterium]|nr:BMP family ABC transporter substrate-binding protein [Clostridia bacterium]